MFGSPIVDEGKPTLLMDQHYDVQPIDPFAEWDGIRERQRLKAAAGFLPARFRR